MWFFSRQMDKRIAAYQRELIETHYQEVETMYKQIRGWRHDYRNHIQAMKALAANDNMDAIKEYLDKLDMDLSTVDTVVKTGNAMADAIRYKNAIHPPDETIRPPFLPGTNFYYMITSRQWCISHTAE